jgi:uncharacterized protein (TIGR03545 family)
LVALILLCFLVDYGVARALRWGIIRNGEEMIGAKVGVGPVRSSILAAHMTITGFEVVNPYSPLKNLLAADAIDCTFDKSALLQKQFIVDHAAVRGLSFGTPRDESKVPDLDKQAATPLGACVDAQAAAKARIWLETINLQFGQEFVGGFESIRLADEMARKWPERYRALDPRVTDFKVKAKNFQAKIAAAHSNPLRHPDFFDRLPGELEILRVELEKLNAEMDGLAQAVEADRRAVAAARRQDEETLRRRLQIEPIDPKALTAFLVQEQLSGPLGELMGWIHWIRRVAPEHPIASARPRSRGVDIPFAERRTSPDLLIRTLDVQGTLHVASQPIAFAGRASDVSTQPHLHSHPMQFDLSATSGLPLRLVTTIDRTGAVARDELTLRCQNILLPKLQLGEANRFRLSIEPSRASLNIQIVLEGDQLSGGIRLVQKDVELTPEFSGSGSTAAMNSALRDALPDKATLVTELNLSGSLNSPRCEMWSDMGSVVASAFGQAVGRAVDQHSDSLAARAREDVDQRLARADLELDQSRRQIQDKLNGPKQLVDQLFDQVYSRNGLSAEAVSRRTSSQSIIR